MRALLAVLILAAAACGGNGTGSEEPVGEGTTTTLEGCVQTAIGCIDPDSIEPGECIPSTPESDDCVNYRPPLDEDPDVEDPEGS